MADKVSTCKIVKINGEFVSLAAAQELADRATRTFNTGATKGDSVNMVFGVQDEKRERIVMFSLVAGLTRERLARAAREYGLPQAAIPAPTDIHILDDFPRLATGKVDMHAMKQKAAGISSG
ncbi:MAG: hypothetical protein ACAH83_17355 [Alphaproteobacteria bacterium]